MLQEVHRILKPAGYVAQSLPNWDSIERSVFKAGWIAVDAPRHLYHLTPITIGVALEKSGLVVRRLDVSAGSLSLASNTMHWLGYRVYGTSCWSVVRDIPSSIASSPKKLKV